MDWLQSLSFRGVMSEGRLIGKYSLSAYVQTLPALKPGETRVDRFAIADKVRNASFLYLSISLLFLLMGFDSMTLLIFGEY